LFGNESQVDVRTRLILVTDVNLILIFNHNTTSVQRWIIMSIWCWILTYQPHFHFQHWVWSSKSEFCHCFGALAYKAIFILKAKKVQIWHYFTHSISHSIPLLELCRRNKFDIDMRVGRHRFRGKVVVLHNATIIKQCIDIYF